jgi:site-specific DNA-methyltransferase (adenine-specific)
MNEKEEGAETSVSAIILKNGDCIEEMKKLESKSITLIFTDLPYANNTTHLKWDCLINLKDFWEEVDRVCVDNALICLSATMKFAVCLINSNPKMFKYEIIWEKSTPCSFLNARKQPMRSHELLLFFYKKPPIYNYKLYHRHKYDESVEIPLGEKEENYGSKVYGMGLGGTKLYDIKKILKKKGHKIIGNTHYDPPLPTSVMKFKSERGKHPTQKPVPLIEWVIKYFSNEGDRVLDATMGSGSTGVACKNLNRKFVGIERDNKYFNIACERMNVRVTPLPPALSKV